MTATIERLENGLVVIVEEMPWLQSVAVDLYLPGGRVADPARKCGLALLFSHLLSRGAGDLDSFGVTAAFENLGAHHGEDASSDAFHLHVTSLGDDLGAVMKLLFLLVREPTLPREHIDPIRSLLLQDIASLADQPSRWANVEAGMRFYPAPYNRPALGISSEIESIVDDDARQLWSMCFRPNGAVLSIAGKVDTRAVVQLLTELTVDWKGEGLVPPPFGALQTGTNHHIQAESQQVQIILGWPSVRELSPDYYAAKVLSDILSGGMYGRMFLEVREKRGLCYAVSARHSVSRNCGVVWAYAGTTSDRSAETLQVMLQVLDGLSGSITQAEVSRAQRNLRASLIMGEESPSSRAGSNVMDWWVFRRVRSLDEIDSQLQSVSVASVEEFLSRYSFEAPFLLTLGKKALR